MFHLIIILFSPFPFLVVKIELLRFAFLFPPPVLHTRTTRIPGASLVAQRLKRLPPMQETWVWSLGREDPLEKEMATHSSILAWRIPWTEELGRLQSMGLQRAGHDWATSLHFTRIPSLTLLVKKSQQGEKKFLCSLIAAEKQILFSTIKLLLPRLLLSSLSRPLDFRLLLLIYPGKVIFNF